MTFDQLRIFLAVADEEHLTRAAAALGLTPSAVSAAIRALEARHGVRLFSRVGRGIELTEAGRTLVPEARATLASAAQAERALAELGGLMRGTLAVQASQTIASYWIGPRLAAFHQRHPGIEIRLGIGNTATVAQAVLAGSAELGLIEGTIDEPALAVRQVASDRLIVVVAAGHPWASGCAVRPAMLPAAEWIMREPGSGTRSEFETALRAAGVDPADLPVALTLPSNEAVRSALQAGGFAAVMSELAASAELAAGRLVQVNLPLPPRRFCLLAHKERYRSRAAVAFAELLATELPAEAPAG